VKAKTCFICKKDLPQRRTRFCSIACSEYNDSIKRKANTLRLSTLLVPRECINCKGMYPPKTSRQKCCSRACSDFLAAELQKKRRAERREQNGGEAVRGAGNRSRKIGQYGKPTAINIPKTLVGTAVFTRADTKERVDLQSKVEEYLANGGKIMKYGDQPAITISDSITKWEISSEEQDIATEKYRVLNAYNGN
jgi:predicted nucleic acid-binding Zn ribbon protein